MNEEQTEPLNANSPHKPTEIELQRLHKIYLDELESLRREELEIIAKFNLTLSASIFVSNWDAKFTYEDNLRLFLNELAQAEETLYKTSAGFNQHDVNIALSKLRILREKGNTVFMQAQNREKEVMG